jgi:diadenosine tetraphosphate (Ap4A) HIT family hydrolase
MRDSCTHCATVAGQTGTPGGVIHDDGLWVVVHHPGPYADPGELLVIIRRHCESVGELSSAEASALGPLLRAGVMAIERLVTPERVYVASFNERIRHVHFYLLPRTAAVPAGHVTADLFRRGRGILRGLGIATNPTVEARAEAARRIRDEDVWRHLRD